MLRCTLFAVCVLSVSGCATPTFNSVGGMPWQFGSIIRPDYSGEASFLVTAKSYQDFMLTVEFKPDANVNSGVFFRCQDPDEITPLNCYEANIWDNHPLQRFRTGAVVEVFAPPLVRVETIGRWNKYEIEARGDSITVKVNNVVTAAFSSGQFSQGFIAFQWAGKGSIDFRNLSITPI